MGQPACVPILDTRTGPRFAAGHAAGAVNIPLEDFGRRAHELPPKGTVLSVFDDDPDRWREAAAALRRRGYAVTQAPLTPSDRCETGPSRGRLWQPSPFLVEALAAIRACAAARTGRDALAAGGEFAGRALDLACGSGREAVYLALSGYEVDAIDVLPDALDRAQDLARRCGVRLNTVRQDLRRKPDLPAERYGLVTVFRFLHRPLLAAIRRSVAPGGFVVYEAFHERDRAEGRKPLKPGRLVSDGELVAAFDGFEPLIARDGLQRDGRVFSQLLARRLPFRVA